MKALKKLENTAGSIMNCLNMGNFFSESRYNRQRKTRLESMRNGRIFSLN